MKGHKTVKFQLSIAEELDRRLLEWRRQQPNLPNRSEAIRQLVEAALTAWEKER